MAPQYLSSPIGIILSRWYIPPFFAYIKYTLSTPMLSVTIAQIGYGPSKSWCCDAADGRSRILGVLLHPERCLFAGAPRGLVVT